MLSVNGNRVCDYQYLLIACEAPERNLKSPEKHYKRRKRVIYLQMARSIQKYDETKKKPLRHEKSTEKEGWSATAQFFDGPFIINAKCRNGFLKATELCNRTIGSLVK